MCVCVCSHLVLQALLRHGEVDDGHLDAHLGEIVRVGQLTSQEKLECIVVRNGVLADFHHNLSALLKLLLQKHGFESGIKRLANIFQQDPLTKAHAVLEAANKILF